MDPNTVVLEISSDEDVDWNDRNEGGFSDGDDHNWLTELLDEVNKVNYGDDSDEVVVISESEKTVKKSKLKSCVVDLDDDCVVLDNDPNEPVEIVNGDQSKGDADNDDDDLVVVSEKGQVACRDYPHSRHLCIKFPFSTTPNQTHCEQCYCYVCDSLAPCLFWGNGNANTDHCHATDKDEIWILARKTSKNGNKPVNTVPPVDPFRPPPMPPVSPVRTVNQIPRLGSNHLHHPPANYRPPSIINQNRNHILASRNKLHPNVVSLMLYGYFVGTSMDFSQVNYSLRRMWRAHDLVKVTKNGAGFYFFKFKSEEGMNAVLENGSWPVDNIPLVVCKWEAGVCLQKIEPSKVSLWVCVHDIPIEMWHGRCIGKIVSAIGKPVIMDKVTKERCVNRSGRMGYARVLVEVDATDELPDEVEVVYPDVGPNPGQVISLGVSYQWKPPLCTFCKVFGHSHKLCKVRPIT